jgi:site-specific DNA recombinase
MAEGHNGKDREVRLDYAFDRLLATKLQQVYEILVPDRVRIVSKCSALNGGTNENCGDLRQGLVRQVEGREHNCEPNGGVGGVRGQGRLRRSA